uniref:YqaE/Pmp3 family membrane protein n=1 Tax=Rhizophora mucronata TaxID=61149 RepID=A0A2P2PT43_RHIMU
MCPAFLLLWFIPLIGWTASMFYAKQGTNMPNSFMPNKK